MHILQDLQLRSSPKGLGLITLPAYIPQQHQTGCPGMQRRTVQNKGDHGNNTTFPQYQVDLSDLFFLIAQDYNV